MCVGETDPSTHDYGLKSPQWFVEESLVLPVSALVTQFVLLLFLFWIKVDELVETLTGRDHGQDRDLLLDLHLQQDGAVVVVDELFQDGVGVLLV